MITELFYLPCLSQYTEAALKLSDKFPRGVLLDKGILLTIVSMEIACAMPYTDHRSRLHRAAYHLFASLTSSLRIKKAIQIILERHEQAVNFVDPAIENSYVTIVLSELMENLKKREWRHAMESLQKQVSQDAAEARKTITELKSSDRKLINYIKTLFDVETLAEEDKQYIAYRLISNNVIEQL